MAFPTQARLRSIQENCITYDIRVQIHSHTGFREMCLGYVLENVLKYSRNAIMASSSKYFQCFQYDFNIIEQS